VGRIEAVAADLLDGAQKASIPTGFEATAGAHVISEVE
jgi:hypothetical protein